MHLYSLMVSSLFLSNLVSGVHAPWVCLLPCLSSVYYIILLQQYLFLLHFFSFLPGWSKPSCFIAVTLILLFIYLASISDFITSFFCSIWSSLCCAHMLIFFLFLCHLLFCSHSVSLVWIFSWPNVRLPFSFSPSQPALFFFPFLPSKRSTEHYIQPCTYCSLPILLAVLHTRFPKPNTTLSVALASPQLKII